MARDLLKELDEWDGWPAAWDPKPGEAIQGTILMFSTGPTAYGEVRTCIIEQDGGKGRVSVWMSSTVLLSLFDREKPKVGERVGIKYLGKHETKKYRQYRLVVDRDEPTEPNFEPLGGERGGDHDEDDLGGALPRDPFADEEPSLPEPPRYARETMAPAGRRFGRN